MHCMPATIKENELEPLKMQELPDGSWEVIAIDFKGPIGENHKYIFAWMNFPDIQKLKLCLLLVRNVLYQS